MKCYSCPSQEKTTAVDQSALINLIMAPESIHGSFERINLEGRNNGAKMITRRNSSDVSSDCCGINLEGRNNGAKMITRRNSSDVSSDCCGINLEGRNNGAAMIIRRNSSDVSSDHCGVNIYINNNVQGVNNSILVGSEVNVRDPAVCLSLKDVKFGRGSLGAKKKYNLALGFCWVLVTVLAMLLLFLSVIYHLGLQDLGSHSEF